MYRPYAVGVPGFSSDPESAIRGLSQDFCTGFNTGNYDQVSALFASDAIFMPPHRESSQGPRMIERALTDLGEKGYQGLRFETVRVDYSGDLAIEVGTYSVTISREGFVLPDRGKYLRGWRRLGAWLIIADCWTSSLAAPEKGTRGLDTKVA